MMFSVSALAFPEVSGPIVVSILAGVLRGVLSQRLLPQKGGGRIPAVEVMVSNARIAELIRERRADEIPDAIAEGEFFQMQTFSQALIELVLNGLVEREVALDAATNRHDFEIAMQRAEKLAAIKTANAAKEAAQAVEPAEPVERPKDDGLPALRVAGG